MSEAGYRIYEREREALCDAKPLRFSCDTAGLKKWLCRRKSSLEKVRQDFEPLWKEIRKYFEPNIGKALLENKDRDGAASRREDEKILNSEPRLAVHRYAAGMQSGITNKAQAWCSIVPKGVSEDDARDPELNEWCNVATTEILGALERANFYRVSQNVYPHGALLGTSCVLILRGEGPGDIHFHLIDEGDYWIAEDRFGRVDTLLRRVPMTVGQAKQEFLVGNMPQEWRRKIAEGRLEDRIEVWNYICPNDGSEKFKDVDASRPWVSVYFTGDDRTGADENDGILDISSFTYQPMAVLRQMDSGAVYGKGIGEMSLPDCKELQELEDYLLRMIANEAEPSMIAPASMKGKPINMFPGGVTFYDGIMGTGGQAPITRLFQTQEGIDKVDVKIQGITDRIGRMWYNDLFAMMLSINQSNRSQKTATEVSELSGEKVTLLGPVLTQMDEFLTPVVDGVFAILLEDGIIPEAPAALRDGFADIAVEYTSTIHSEMRAALKMRAVNMLIEMVGMLGQANPEAIDKIDVDKVIDDVCRVYPGAAAYVLGSKEVAALREGRAKAQRAQMEQAQMVEMMKNAGANAKALSDAKVGNGNALDLLMGGG